MTDTRDFKGVFIPNKVWKDTRLTALDKVILVQIDTMGKDENGYSVSNSELADFCHCSTTKVSTTISKLRDLGYISIEKFDGRKRKMNVSF